jgi:arylsulfatase A-like enzyme
VSLPRPVDGVDLLQALRDPEAQGRDAYVSQTDTTPPYGQKYMVRTEEWKYVYCQAGGNEELYDATRPDGELLNRADDPALASTLAQLRAYLIRWCQEHGDTRMVQDGELLATPLAVQSDVEFDVNRLGWRRY